MPPDQEHQPEPQQGGESNFSPEEWENWALGVDQGLSNLEQDIEELKSAASNLGQTAEDRLRGIHIKMDALVLDLQQHYLAETRKFLDQNVMAQAPLSTGPASDLGNSQALLKQAQESAVTVVLREDSSAAAGFASQLGAKQTAFQHEVQGYFNWIEECRSRIAIFGEEIQGTTNKYAKKLI